MKRILIADDDSMNCVMAKHALCNEYHVTTVYTGKEALTCLGTVHPDLILMDIEMPEMSGREVARIIKENPKWSKIPIIFLTDDSDPITSAECLKWGADDFITKPLVPALVQSRVSRILELQELRKDLETQIETKSPQAEMERARTLTDTLTGLYNRVYLKKRLQGLLRAGHAGTMFMIDLDNFKKINDNYGHIVGDKTLQHFAEILKENTKADDMVCRLAGNGFVVFYTDLTDREIAAQNAEEIIQKFAERLGELGYGGIASVSIGVVIAEAGEEFQNLYNKADKALYFVKNSGKNAYHFYGEQQVKPDEINTVVDLECVRHMMEDGITSGKGAFHLAYDEFKKIYDFALRCVSRQKKVQIALFTLNLKGEQQSGEFVESAMCILEDSVISSLRASDAGTRYSNSQYIVILMDTDIENGKAVVERVVKKFYENYYIAIMGVTVSYDIQTIEANLKS